MSEQEKAGADKQPKHTPGPWHWEGHPEAAGYVALATRDSDVILPTSDAEVRVVASVWPADAALIAAAPDLLAACVAMLAAVDGSHAQVMAAVGRMKVAVAKATTVFPF